MQKRPHLQRYGAYPQRHEETAALQVDRPASPFGERLIAFAAVEHLLQFILRYLLAKAKRHHAGSYLFQRTHLA